MKKVLLFMAFVISISFAKSQTSYHNYLDCSSEWRYYQQGNSSAGPSTSWFITKYFDGDTIINGLYYYRQKELWRKAGDTSGIYKGFTGYGTNSYFIREDANENFIGYAYNPLGVAYFFDTLYRFKKIKQLQIGDSLTKSNAECFYPGLNSYCSRATIESIDSFLLGSRTLRATFPMDSSYNVTSVNIPKIYACIVEGIGATFPAFYYSGAGDNSILYMFYYKKQANQLAFNTSSPVYPLDSFPIPIRVNSCALPLKLLSFSAKFQPTPNPSKEGNVLLQWQTANEVNVSHFNIQRSANGKDFTTIGKVNAGNIEYQYTDNSLPLTVDGRLYYRLEMVDKDGSKTYSTIKQITIKPQTPNLVIYPNPAKEFVNIDCAGAKELLIIDYLGKTVKQYYNITEHQTVH